MANGGTLTGLLSEQRGALGVIAVVATTMAGGLGAGLSAYYQSQSRAYTDEQITQVIENRIQPQLKARADYTDYRYGQLAERMGKAESQIEKNGEEFRKVWSAIADRPDRSALADANQDDRRRLDRLETEHENFRRLMYGNRYGGGTDGRQER